MALTPSVMSPLGSTMPEFELTDTEGQRFSVAREDVKAGVLVIFMCNHCPFVVHLREALARVTSSLMARGLTVVGISSNDAEAYPQDGPEAMKRERASAGYEFPYLFDETQEVARAFDAACTPDFFLYDASLKLVYRGRFDASRPSNNEPVDGASLLAAAESLLETGAVSDEVEQLPSVGCNVKWRDA